MSDQMAPDDRPQSKRRIEISSVRDAIDYVNSRHEAFKVMFWVTFVIAIILLTIAAIVYRGAIADGLMTIAMLVLWVVVLACVGLAGFVFYSWVQARWPTPQAVEFTLRVNEIPPRPEVIRLDGMDADKFEELVCLMYRAQGYNATVIGGSHDGGVDIIAEREVAGGRDRIAVQCKRWAGNVGRPELQKLWGVIHDDQSFTRADIVTTGGFTREAIEFADRKRFSLIGREKLVETIKKFSIVELAD